MIRPVGLNVMRECGDALVEIQGQFEGRGLLDLSTHGVLLDRFANHDDLLLACRNTWQGWQDAATQYETAAAARKDAEANAAWLKEAVEQLDQLAPEDNEESKLMEERDVLANVTRIADALSQVDHLINGDSGALSQIAQSSRQISRISDVAGSLTNDIEAALERAEVEISEVERALSTAQANLEGDPNRMIAVDDRLHDLRQQARKHEVEADHLLACMMICASALLH
jgi:DNA repair protein RecN (Recombination protein N)